MRVFTVYVKIGQLITLQNSSMESEKKISELVRAVSELQKLLKEAEKGKVLTNTHLMCSITCVTCDVDNKTDLMICFSQH